MLNMFFKKIILLIIKGFKLLVKINKAGKDVFRDKITKGLFKIINSFAI